MERKGILHWTVAGARQRRRMCALVVGFFTGIAACDDALRPTGPGSTPSFSIDEVAQEDEPSQLAVAQAVPGFGGYFFDNGAPTVYLTDVSQRPAAERALAGWLDSYGLRASDLRVRQADYDYLQLNSWYSSSWTKALAVNGAVFSDIDEGANRLRFGGLNGGALAEIASTLTNAGVPSAAVVVELAAPVQMMQAVGLRDTMRPMQGGYQINFLNAGGVVTVSLLCTMGFNAVKDGKNSFITNSHCSTVQGGSETGTDYYQPLQDTETTGQNGDLFANADLLIAREVHDPHYFISLDCPVGRTCRYSDASRAEYIDGQGFAKGRIGRPTIINNANIADDPATLEVDLTNPTFRIVAEQSNTALGAIVNKVGRTTGRTRGAVTATCVNVNITASQITQLCQNRAAAFVAGGDSGSPIFTENLDGTVNLAGILWGSSTNLTTGEVQTIFSPFEAIERELGALDTADPITTTGGKKPKKKVR